MPLISFQMKNYNHNGNRPNRIWSGLIILAIGIMFLLRNFDIDLPRWVFSWHSFLIVIGLLIGFKRRFNGGGWLIMVLIGGYFTLEEIVDFDLSEYFLPAAFILLGLFLILKPKRPDSHRWGKKTADFSSVEDIQDEGPSVSENDYIDAVNVFSNSKQHIYSKDFRGGDLVSIFGGCELNLMQADFEKELVLDVVAIFGGTKIIIPPVWEVKSELTAIFGGIDDKRMAVPVAGQPHKIIRIKGVALFGGLSITNY